MQLFLHRFELPLKHRFAISRGSRDFVHSLVVELQHGGFSGYGEATANAYYGTTLDSLAAQLESVRPLLASAAPDDPERFQQLMQEKLGDATFARCALDEAAWDLYGKLAGIPLWTLWNLSHDNLPASSFTIGLDDVETMQYKLAEAPGWPVYKIKLGSSDDLEIVRRLRGCTTAPFRVDANCGWSPAQTIRNSRVLAELGVEFIEQPLPAGDWQGMAAVFADSALPIIADESCRSPADVQRCRECFHGVNVKLMKCGGLTPAREMLSHARRLGLKTMLGCMTESTVGISAAAQLLPLADYADLDGAALLAQDSAHGVKVECGRCIFPPENGVGVTLLA